MKDIEGAIKVAGLDRNKSEVIKNISQVILKQFNGFLGFIYTSPLEVVRKMLLTIRGVGPETAY